MSINYIFLKNFSAFISRHKAELIFLICCDFQVMAEIHYHHLENNPSVILIPL